MPQPPRILALCPEYNIPSGGIRKIYHHVDVLNSNSFSACVLHQTTGFRTKFFDNKTVIRYTPQTPLLPSDVLILPEVVGPPLAATAPGVPKVIFNQNSYYTFKGYGLEADALQTPYGTREVLATLVVSEDSRQYLAYAFPGHRVFRIHNAIDPALFHDRDQKRPCVAFMPRKNREDAVQVINLLKCRGALRGFDLRAIENQTEAVAAQQMRQSMVFLSFGTPEGFCLPAAEAMSCGCVTIGYHGRGGREFFTPDHGFPIEAGDILGFATTVERVLADLRHNPEPLLQITKRAAAFIRETYSPERERQDILDAWRQILELRDQRQMDGLAKQGSHSLIGGQINGDVPILPSQPIALKYANHRYQISVGTGVYTAADKGIFVSMAWIGHAISGPIKSLEFIIHRVVYPFFHLGDSNQVKALFTITVSRPPRGRFELAERLG